MIRRSVFRNYRTQLTNSIVTRCYVVHQVETADTVIMTGPCVLTPLRLADAAPSPLRSGR